MTKMRPYLCFCALLLAGAPLLADDSEASERLVWPAAPDPARIEYVGTVECAELSPGGSFLRKLSRWIGGRSESDRLSLPFDVTVADGHMYLVCQKFPALVQVDRIKDEFRVLRCDERPLEYPVAVCNAGDGMVLVSDPETATIYRLYNDELKPFLTESLVRPTGVAALPSLGRIYVVDTGEQSLKIFDYDGLLIKTVNRDEAGEPLFNYPTFASVAPNDEILVNDGLNYRIRRFDAEGRLLGSFGEEGDGPGTFSRPKGLAVDSDAHIYVIDNLFDNLQVFDHSGQVLLTLGSAGNAPGQFWSPAGVAISADTIYVADTYNHRIQILHYLGEAP